MADIHWFRLAIGLWIGLTVAVCVKAKVQDVDHSVYRVYAWSSRHWWSDQPLHANYLDTDKVDLYRYSLTFAVLFTPFSMLSDWR